MSFHRLYLCGILLNILIWSGSTASDSIRGNMNDSSHKQTAFRFKVAKDGENITEHEHGVHVASWKYSYVQKPLLITAFIVLIAIIKIIFHHAHRFSAVIPESCVLIVLGILLGFLFLIREAKAELDFLGFEYDSFFLFLLPPIVLEAAYSLKDRAFVDCLGTIMLYAVVGTILNILLVAPVLYGFYLMGVMGNVTLRFLECLIFAATVSAVDPVAVLAIFQEVGVNKVLYFMVFGESLFNDAVTIVIYQMVLSFMSMEQISVVDFGLGIAAFLCVSVGAMILGFIYGFLTAFVTKYTAKIRVVEPIIVFGLAYLSYITAELFHFSGIISIICCGLIQAHYAEHNVSAKSYISISYFSKVGSGVTESLIFIILGVMLVNDHESWADFNVVFAVTSLVLCIVARFIVVFFLAFCVNKHLSGIRKISKQEQFIMAYGGLRGAITFSLVFTLGANQLGEGTKTRNILYTSAFVIIFFTTFLQGITIKPLVKLMRIRLQTTDTSLFKEVHHAVLENAMAGIEEIIGHKGSHALRSMAKNLSRRFLRPLLHRHPHQECKGVLATYQEVSMQSQYSSHQLTAEAAPYGNDFVILNELDQDEHITQGAVMHSVHNSALDRIDEQKETMRKQRKQELRQRSIASAVPVRMSFDRPSDLLHLRDILLAAPHKAVHYVMDKNLSEEQSNRVQAQIQNISNIRSKDYRAPMSVSNQLLSSALLPMGMGMMIRADRPASLLQSRHNSSRASRQTKREISIRSDKNNISTVSLETNDKTPASPKRKPDEPCEFEIGL